MGTKRRSTPKGKTNAAGALRDAARDGDRDALQAALDAGAGPNEADPTGRTALYLAAREGHVAIVEVLISAGANVNHAIDHDPELNERSPLSAPQKAMLETLLGQLGGQVKAARQIDPDVGALGAGLEKSILKAVAGARAGAPVTSFGARYATAIGIAARFGHAPVIAALAKAHATLESERFHSSPLLVAVKHGQVDAVRALLAAGADPLRPGDASGITPAEAALEGPSTAMQTTFRSVAAVKAIVPVMELHQACHTGDLTAAERALRAGASPNALTPSKRWPALTAAAGGHLRIVERLLTAGLTVTEQLLERAAENGHDDVAITLFERFEAAGLTKAAKARLTRLARVGRLPRFLSALEGPR